mgnify:CR=1 FL=1
MRSLLLNERFVFGLIGLGNDFAGAGDLLPYLIGWLVALIVPVLGAIVLFLIFEPDGLAHRWKMIKAYWKLYPFSY